MQKIVIKEVGQRKDKQYNNMRVFNSTLADNIGAKETIDIIYYPKKDIILRNIP